MKNTINHAYLVLSVGEIRAMLHAALLEQKVRGEGRESICIVLRDITVSDDGQISSVMEAVDRLVVESNNALEDTAAKRRD